MYIMKNQLKYFLLNGYQEYNQSMMGGASSSLTNLDDLDLETVTVKEYIEKLFPSNAEELMKELKRIAEADDDELYTYTIFELILGEIETDALYKIDDTFEQIYKRTKDKFVELGKLDKWPWTNEYIRSSRYNDFIKKNSTSVTLDDVVIFGKQLGSTIESMKNTNFNKTYTVKTTKTDFTGPTPIDSEIQESVFFYRRMVNGQIADIMARSGRDGHHVLERRINNYKKEGTPSDEYIYYENIPLFYREDPKGIYPIKLSFKTLARDYDKNIWDNE